MLVPALEIGGVVTMDTYRLTRRQVRATPLKVPAPSSRSLLLYIWTSIQSRTNSSN
jgi:hypothetical protein